MNDIQTVEAHQVEILPPDKRRRREPRIRSTDPDHVGSLPLIANTYNALLRQCCPPVLTIAELTRFSADELRRIKNIGHKGVEAINVALAARGLSLRPNWAPPQHEPGSYGWGQVLYTRRYWGVHDP
jgi:DNA-directed RNA polymerase alpha subunit